jgi:hypothetical protein
MACVGAPFVPVVLVENQARVGSAWAAQRNQAVLDARSDAWAPALARRVDELLMRPDGERAARAPSDLVDGQGAHRVLQACAALGAHGARTNNLHDDNPG